MPGPYLTTAAVLQRIADFLHKEVSELNPRWGRVAETANRKAHADIERILLGRGYTQAQVDGWAHRQSYSEDQALYWAGKLGSGLASYDQQAVDAFDHRKELSELSTIIIGGVAVAPPGTTEVGGIAYDTLSAVDDALGVVTDDWNEGTWSTAAE